MEPYFIGYSIDYDDDEVTLEYDFGDTRADAEAGADTGSDEDDDETVWEWDGEAWKRVD